MGRVVRSGSGIGRDLGCLTLGRGGPEGQQHPGPPSEAAGPEPGGVFTPLPLGAACWWASCRGSCGKACSFQRFKEETSVPRYLPGPCRPARWRA